MGLVRLLSLLLDDVSEDELLDRELDPELELLEDLEALEELLSDELKKTELIQ